VYKVRRGHPLRLDTTAHRRSVEYLRLPMVDSQGGLHSVVRVLASFSCPPLYLWLPF
jgi:hypothetical protein